MLEIITEIEQKNKQAYAKHTKSNLKRDFTRLGRECERLVQFEHLLTTKLKERLKCHNRQQWCIVGQQEKGYKMLKTVTSDKNAPKQKMKEFQGHDFAGSQKQCCYDDVIKINDEILTRYPDTF